MAKKIDKKLYVILAFCVSILIAATIFFQYSDVCLTQSCKTERIASMKLEINSKWKMGKSEFSDLNNLLKNVSEQFNNSVEKKFDKEISKLRDREIAIADCGRNYSGFVNYDAMMECESIWGSEKKNISNKIKYYSTEKSNALSKSNELLKMSDNAIENVRLLDPEVSVSDAEIILANIKKIDASLDLFIASDEVKSALDSEYIKDKIGVKNSISSRLKENINGIILIHKNILEIS